jgi:predicted RNase H-like HicB family nuclease
VSDYHSNAFYSEDDGGYIADIPDLEACSAFGGSPEEALAEVEKAKKAWLDAARAAGKPIPEPRYRPAIYAREVGSTSRFGRARSGERRLELPRPVRRAEPGRRCHRLEERHPAAPDRLREGLVEQQLLAAVADHVVAGDGRRRAPALVPADELHLTPPAVSEWMRGRRRRRR